MQLKQTRGLGGAALLFIALTLIHASRLQAQMAPEPVNPAADPTFDDVGSDLDAQGEGFPDPLENVNRGTLKFNLGVERWVLHPTVSAYRFVVPEPGRLAVRNVIGNLNSPATLVNDLLQLEMRDAAITTARFLLNT